MNTHHSDQQVEAVYPEATALPPEQTLFATRNAAMMVQEQTRLLHERPILGKGLRHYVRRFVINQFVRPFVMPLIEQQQEHNAAVLRSMYTLAEITDRFYARLNEAWGEVERAHARLDDLSEGLHSVHARLNEAWGEVERAHARLDDLGQGLHQMNERVLHHSHLVSQTFDEIAEQLAGLEEADDQLCTLLNTVDRSAVRSRSKGRS